MQHLRDKLHFKKKIIKNLLKFLHPAPLYAKIIVNHL